MSKYTNNSNLIVKEKQEVSKVKTHLETRHERVKNLISVIFTEINHKETQLKSGTLDTSERSVLECDISSSQNRLEKAIFEKELIRKDLAIIQTRLRSLEDEIYKTKPWWFKLFRGKK